MKSACNVRGARQSKIINCWGGERLNPLGLNINQEFTTDDLPLKCNWRRNLNCHVKTCSKMCDYVLYSHSLNCGIFKIVRIVNNCRNT